MEGRKKILRLLFLFILNFLLQLARNKQTSWRRWALLKQIHAKQRALMMMVKMAEVSQTNIIIKLIDKLFFEAATDDMASKELWKQEKKLRFLIRRCCKVKELIRGLLFALTPSLCRPPPGSGSWSSWSSSTPAPWRWNITISQSGLQSSFVSVIIRGLIRV